MASQSIHASGAPAGCAPSPQRRHSCTSSSRAKGKAGNAPISDQRRGAPDLLAPNRNWPARRSTRPSMLAMIQPGVDGDPHDRPGDLGPAWPRYLARPKERALPFGDPRLRRPSGGLVRMTGPGWRAAPTGVPKCDRPRFSPGEPRRVCCGSATAW